jgi:hypothetical protein
MSETPQPNAYFKNVRCSSKRDLLAVVLGQVNIALEGISISEEKRAEVIVQLANYPTGLRLDLSILPAKDAVTMPSQNPKKSPSETDSSPTDSAPTVEPKYDLILPVNDPTSASVNCSTCKATTTALVWKIIPSGIETELDPLKALELSKRLIFCTGCCNMRLVN